MRQKAAVIRTVAILTLFIGLGALQALILNAAEAPAATGGSIQGTVIHYNGKPAVNLTVSVMTVPGRGQFPVLVGTATTDAHGKFRVNGIATGKYSVQAATLSSTSDVRTYVFNGLTSQVVLLTP